MTNLERQLIHAIQQKQNIKTHKLLDIKILIMFLKWQSLEFYFLHTVFLPEIMHSEPQHEYLQEQFNFFFF